MFALFSLVALCGAMAFAESYTGKLLDANCPEIEKGGACPATSATTMFAINVAGKLYKLDDAGNAKAVEAVKSRADRTSDPSKGPAALTAKVTGTPSGSTIKVDAIEVQ
jgi:hypothetical protein